MVLSMPPMGSGAPSAAPAGADARGPGTKRRNQGDGDKGSFSEAMEGRLQELERLSEQVLQDVGEGDFAMPLVFAIGRQLLVQSQRMDVLEGILLTQWEFPMPNVITGEAQEMGKRYHQYCQTVKGQGKRVGSPGTWKFYGLLVTTFRILGSECEGVKKWDPIIEAELASGGTLDQMKIRNLWKYCTACKVKETKKAAYVQLHLTPAGQELAELLHRTFTSNKGTLSVDAPPPTPAIRDIKNVMQKMGYWGPGGPAA